MKKKKPEQFLAKKKSTLLQSNTGSALVRAKCKCTERIDVLVAVSEWPKHLKDPEILRKAIRPHKKKNRYYRGDCEVPNEFELVITLKTAISTGRRMMPQVTLSPKKKL